MLDSDSSGYITSQELKNALKEMCVESSPEEFRKLWQHLDKDKDNKLSFVEFAVGMKSWILNSASASSPLHQLLSSPTKLTPTQSPLHPSSSSSTTPSKPSPLATKPSPLATNSSPLSSKHSPLSNKPSPLQHRGSLLDLSREMQRGHAQFEFTKRSLKEMFSMCDVDGDGKLSLLELSRVLRELGISSTTKERQELFQQLDVDGDGSVSFEEFALGLRLMTPTRKDDSETSSSPSSSSSTPPSSAPPSSSSTLSTTVAVLKGESEQMAEYIGLFFEKSVRKAAELSESGRPADLLAAKAVLELLHYSGIGPLEKSLGRTLMTDWTVANYKPLVQKIKNNLRPQQ